MHGRHLDPIPLAQRTLQLRVRASIGIEERQSRVGQVHDKVLDLLRCLCRLAVRCRNGSGTFALDGKGRDGIRDAIDDGGDDAARRACLRRRICGRGYSFALRLFCLAYAMLARLWLLDRRERFLANV